MSYKVFTILPFDKQLKRLAKRYPSLKREFSDLLESLEANPLQGTLIGKNCYKIRLSISSKGKGKSGGARVITNVLVSKTKVFLISIYDKSERANLSDNELLYLLNQVPEP
jgi:mRNA-degrading endonuclease RelE of RelBE toxin-antitoxin system